jgi:segregation and condensation protein B
MLKNNVESLLFSSGRKMSIDELSKLCKAKVEDIKEALAEMKLEYDDRGSSLMVVNEGDSWKLVTREQYLPLVQKIVTETELSRTVMETLAVIAFKYPIKQSDLIRIRTNKAYDHLMELEQMGYISRVKYGRTKLIKLAQKFFEYFNLPEEKLKEQFKDFSSIAKAIEDKEKEIDTIKDEQKKAAQEEGQKDEKIKEEIEKLGKEGSEEKGPEASANGEVKEETGKQEEKPKFEGEGIKVTKEMEKIIDEKVERMMHPPNEEDPQIQDSQDSSELKTKIQRYNKETEEPKDLIEAEMEEKENKDNRYHNKK